MMANVYSQWATDPDSNQDTSLTALPIRNKVTLDARKIQFATALTSLFQACSSNVDFVKKGFVAKQASAVSKQLQHRKRHLTIEFEMYLWQTLLVEALVTECERINAQTLESDEDDSLNTDDNAETMMNFEPDIEEQHMQYSQWDRGYGNEDNLSHGFPSNGFPSQETGQITPEALRGNKRKLSRNGQTSGRAESSNEECGLACQVKRKAVAAAKAAVKAGLSTAFEAYMQEAKALYHELETEDVRVWAQGFADDLRVDITIPRSATDIPSVMKVFIQQIPELSKCLDDPVNTIRIVKKNTALLLDIIKRKVVTNLKNRFQDGSLSAHQIELLKLLAISMKIDPSKYRTKDLLTVTINACVDFSQRSSNIPIADFRERLLLMQALFESKGA